MRFIQRRERQLRFARQAEAGPLELRRLKPTVKAP
jgi:hypothetical protein